MLITPLNTKHNTTRIKSLYDTEFNSSATINLHSILIVEDDELLKKVTPLILDFCGYSTTLAQTGAEAIEISKNKFDLILLDIRLPDMSGFDVCKQIRFFESKLGIYTPIVAYTAFGELVREESIEAGMDDLITKCSPIPELKSIIEKNICYRKKHDN